MRNDTFGLEKPVRITIPLIVTLINEFKVTVNSAQIHDQMGKARKEIINRVVSWYAE